MNTNKPRPDRLERFARALLALALATAVTWVWTGGDDASGGLFARLVG